MPTVKVDNEVFNMVHTMANKGAKIKDICTRLDLCKTTVNRIRRSKTLTEYKGITQPSTIITSNKKFAQSKVTDSKFKAVKAMLNAGISRNEICNVFDLCKTTVRYIDYCDDLNSYKEYVSSRAKESYRKTKLKNDTNTKPISAYYIENRVYDALREQNELLKIISAKMAFIVEQLS